jgi:hypothetical protein
MMPTWIVWSVQPPPCREKVSCVSILDAARAWAERQFRNGLLAHSGTEVLVRCESDPAIIRPMPAGDTRPPSALPNALTATTYQVKLTIVNAPAFRASLVGVVNDAIHDDPSNGTPRG